MYTTEELEEIELLKCEARYLGISLDSAIQGGEPIAILRQMLDEVQPDKLNWSYDF